MSEEQPPVTEPPPWHAEVWERLGAQLAAARLPHALLLHGPGDSGTSTFALALARLLLCAEPSGGLNCGRCHACALSGAGNHGDLRWIRPQQSRAIRIEQVRALVAGLHATASLGERKVAVLEPAEAMNVHACNALLKSLEEPGRDTYLVLVCERLPGLPATIRSRCQLVRLPAPDRAASLAFLERSGADPGESEQLLALAGGRPMLAARLGRGGLGEELARRRLALRAVLANGAPVAPVWDLWRDLEPEVFLGELAAELRLLLRGLSGDELAGERGRAAFALLDETVQRTRALAAGANPSPQLLVDSLLAKSHIELGRAALGDKISADANGGRGV